MIIRDNDGSEIIHFELSSLEGMKLIDIYSGDIKQKDSNNDAYILSQEEISQFALDPLANSSGMVEFIWKTVSTEKSNKDTTSMSNTARIYIDAKS